jgi:hypothetical protein
MKVLKALTLVLLYSIIFLNKIFAQADYVITKNNDTIHCKIRGDFTYIIGVNRELKYRVNKKDKFIPINSDNITECFLANDTISYVYKKLPGKKISGGFVKWLERGRINLYEQIIEIDSPPAGKYGSSATYTNVYWYINKGTDSLVQVKSDAISHNNIGSHKDRINAFLTMINDCDYVATELKYDDVKKEYDFDKIRAYIKMYNDKCPNK